MHGDSAAKIMSKSRIESFSDGVFAIVLTLLVFNFHVPNLSGPNFNEELYAKLFAMHAYVETYVLSFVLIGAYWIAHHAFFCGLKRADNGLLWINNLFLLFLAFVPFPTQVLGAYPETESAAIFFGAVMVLLSLSFSLLIYYCYFVGKLANYTVSDEYMHRSLTKGVAGATLYAFALALSAYHPDVTLSMYALIPFLFFIPLRVR
jgi:uncharacterized membrane protein